MTIKELKENLSKYPEWYVILFEDSEGNVLDLEIEGVREISQFADRPFHYSPKYANSREDFPVYAQEGEAYRKVFAVLLKGDEENFPEKI